MAQLIVITFDSEAEAGKVRDAVARLERGGSISLDDSAIVVKDAGGKVHVHNQADRGIRVGAVSGGLIALLLGFIFFPLGGLILGTLGGALVGRLADLGVDQKFVKEIEAAMPAGTSALFLIVRQADPNAAIVALKPFKGKVYHTSLATEAEETLKYVLSDKHIAQTSVK